MPFETEVVQLLRAILKTLEQILEELAAANAGR
jgi:hypothetical protein